MAPRAMEEKLKKIASEYARKGKLKRKKGESVKRAKARFTYGTMRNQGKY